MSEQQPLDAIVEQLRKRFRHFDPERAAPLFASEQPGTVKIRGQGEFQALLMANDVLWFYDKARRPINAEGQPQKTKAPKGGRAVLHRFGDERSPVLLVEGEAAGVALLSVGELSVAIAGGVQALTAHGARPKRALFRGRDVVVFFDADQAGRAAAPAVARGLLEQGATRVAILEPPVEGMDPEDWLATFETSELALGALLRLLGTAKFATKVTDAQDSPEDTEPVQVADARLGISGGPPARATAVYHATSGLLLAVYAPLLVTSGARESVLHDLDRYDWVVAPSYTLSGTEYVPRGDAGFADLCRTGGFVLPAPPTPHGGHGPLWADVEAFLRRWVALPADAEYALLTAFVFTSYVIHEDARFSATPYLRLHGPPGSGKSWVLDAVRLLAYRGFAGSATTSNLHRVIDAWFPLCLLVDEHHAESMPRDTAKELATIWNRGAERTGRVVRCVGDSQTPRSFSVFGPKITAGYSLDDDEALQRRTFSINCGDVTSGTYEVRASIPVAMEVEAAELRGRLLDWRTTAWTEPGEDSPRYARLVARAGSMATKYTWPLVAVVPPERDDVVDVLLDVAAARVDAVAAARHETPEATLVHHLAVLADEAYQPGETLVPVARLVAMVRGGNSRADETEVGRMLARLKFRKGRRMVNGTRAYMVLLTDEDSIRFSRFGIEWPDPAADPASSAAVKAARASAASGEGAPI